MGPKKDYTLKDGQTFTIAIPGRNKPTPVAGTNNDIFGSSGASDTSSPGGPVPLLPPPPGGGSSRRSPTQQVRPSWTA